MAPSRQCEFRIPPVSASPGVTQRAEQPDHRKQERKPAEKCRKRSEQAFLHQRIINLLCQRGEFQRYALIDVGDGFLNPQRSHSPDA